MPMMNRIHNSRNPYQMNYKKVLCLCSAGLLRSPTAALVLSQEPYNYNTRAAGVNEDFALVVADEVLIAWADEVVCVEPAVEQRLRQRLGEVLERRGTVVKVLNVPDRYAYRDEELVNIIREQYESVQE